MSSISAASQGRPQTLLALLIACCVGIAGGCSSDGDGGKDSGAAADTSADGLLSDASADSTSDGVGSNDGTADGTVDGGGPTPSPAFAAGCPTPGKSMVRKLTSKTERFEGPASLAAPGDWMLANEKAAFVIKSPTETEQTYFYYGGMLVDAVALNGCSQAAPERFGELPMLIGEINIASFATTVLRTFHGASAEVIADGSDGGAAVLRVWGDDDLFWLVELALVKQAYLEGKPHPISAPLGVKLALDYTLEPDRAVLRVDLVVINQTATPRELHVGAAAFMDDSTEQQVWAGGKFSAGGFTLRTGLPWITGSAVDGAIAIAVDSSNLSTAHISGVDALVPFDQLAEPLKIGAKGGGADQDQQTLWIAVGKGDSDTAVAELEGIVIGGASWSGFDVVGKVADAANVGVAARIELQRRTKAGEWGVLLSTRADATGAYAMRVPRVGAKGDLRLVAIASGRALSEAVAVDISVDGATPVVLELAVGPAGALGHSVFDQHGNGIPARLTLVGDGASAGSGGLEFATGGKGDWPVAPGTYTLHVTRGYTYRPFVTQVTVAPNVTTPVEAKLEKVVDTTGWMAFDGHVHAAPSPDSAVPLAMRYRSAAAEGLEIIVHTEHEIIMDPEPARQASGVAAWVRGVIGEEVTATLPEHTNMMGVTPDLSHPRGAPVKWYGLDLAQIYKAERERGAGIVALNHPRKGCNWLCVIGWDRIKAAPTLQDPTVVGLPASATLWSWDFDAVELLGGMDTRLFNDPSQPESSGTFEDWMSFWNSGHYVAALGVTDVHDWGQPGSPRTYFPVPSDDLAAFQTKWMVDAVTAGHTVVSAGAFARVSVVGSAGGSGGSAGPGDMASSLALKDGAVALKVRIEAIPEVDVTRVLVLVNCDTVLDLKATAPEAVVKFDQVVNVPLSVDSHIVVLAFGKNAMPIGMENAVASKVPRVVTNPIRVDVDGDGKWTPPGGRVCKIKPGG
jgi:hypothetical protein